MSATPILDLAQAPPKARGARRFGWLGVAAGSVLITTSILQDRGALPDWQLPGINAWLLLPVLYLAIAIHELGHAAAAKMVGLDIGGISVGPASWLKSGERWVFRWDWRRWGGGFFKPLTGGVGLDPAPFVWSVAGGPLASLVLTVISALLWMRFGDGLWSSIGTMLDLSLLLFVLTIVPFSSGIAKSDGARLWQFARHPDQTRQVMCLLGVQSEEAHGLRPREWSPGLCDAMMLTDRAGTEYVWSELMTFYRRVDEGSDEEALAHLEHALAASDRSGKMVRHALFLEAAFSSARVRKDAAHAHEWYARASKLRKPASGAAVQAAIAMCEGRYVEALGHLTAARRYVDLRRLDSGLIRFAKAKWAEMEAECAETSVVTAPST